MAMSKSLVPIKPRSLSAVKTIEAKAVVVRPEKGLAVSPRGEGGQLTVAKKGGGTVVVSQSNQQASDGRAVRKDSGELGAMVNAGKNFGVVSARKVVELLATRFGVSPGVAYEAVLPLVMSMGNKRKYEILADGTKIHRRLEGTGYDGKNNKGQFLKGGRKNKLPSGSAGGGTPDDPYSYVSKKRSSVSDKVVPTDAKDRPLQLDDSRPDSTALPAPKKRLALPAGAAGLVDDGAAGFVVTDDMQKTANKMAAKVGKALGDKAGKLFESTDTDSAAANSSANIVVDRVVDAVKKFDRVGSVATRADAGSLRLRDAKAALKARDFAKAVKLFFANDEAWYSEAEQNAAQKLIEKSM